MKHIQLILFRNFISPISIAIFILAAGLMYLGEFKDAWFISVVIIINSIIASIQEIRAYITLKKIELMSAPKARIMVNGKLKEILFTELKKGDIVYLRSGDEIPADCELISSTSFEVNESMLTGESVAIGKKKGDIVLSSSIAVSGEAEARVMAVGDDTKAGEIAQKLKVYKPELTPLQKQIQRLISSLTYVAVALAILVAWRYSRLDVGSVVILKTITSAAIVVVPEGLLLASSLFFAYGSVRLLQAKVLPQKISAIEDMALLQVLATDKTGTLTAPEIVFDNIVNLGNFSESEIKRILKTLNSQTKDKNETAKAILNAVNKNKTYDVMDFMAFSSARKFSGVALKLDDNKRSSFIFGAPEFVMKTFKNKKTVKEISDKVNKLAEKGLRVLLLAEIPEHDSVKDALANSDNALPAALVTLRNDLRPMVRETVDYLQNNGVTIKVISGDNPRTVSFIAKEAGIKNSGKFITGEELSKLNENKFAEAVMENTIFARVLPEQKEKIIQIYQKNKLYTGMIGDGVNDALAIKRANLGISMFDAAPATRRVADLVLMDNSFTSLPDGVKIGSKIMLSIEMISILFFHKIILGVTILLSVLLIGLDYPFLPRHLTYMNFILVTLPTILATIFPLVPTTKVNPQKFWQDTLGKIFSIAILSGLAVSFIYVVLTNFSLADSYSVRSVTVLCTAYFGILTCVLSEKLLNSQKDKLVYVRRIIYAAVVAAFTIIVFSVGYIRSFFEFEFPTVDKISVVLATIVITTALQLAIVKYFRNKK